MAQETARKFALLQAHFAVSLSLSLSLCQPPALSLCVCVILKCQPSAIQPPLCITRKSCWATWARLNESLGGLPFSGQIHHFANKCECAWPKLGRSSSSCSVCSVSFCLANCRSSSSSRGGTGSRAELSWWADGLIIAHSPRCLEIDKSQTSCASLNHFNSTICLGFCLISSRLHTHTHITHKHTFVH